MYEPVYPRVCGGTLGVRFLLPMLDGLSPRVRGYALPHHVRVMGLSPRVRGNPLHPKWVSRHGRSIPACAGEPYPISSSWSIPACAGEPVRRLSPIHSKGVYPRVCGGTSIRLSLIDFQGRVYPRVCGGTGDIPRSIPACAGEPLGASINFAPLIVHVYRSPYLTIDSLADRDRGGLLTLNCT